MPSSDSARRFFGLFTMLLALAGCSSAPDAPEYEVAVKNQATRYTEFGNSYFTQGDYPMALQFFDLALQENLSVDNLSGIAKSYNSIARVYSATGELEAARNNLRLAMEHAVLAEDAEQEMQAYINRGEVALRAGEEDAALADFQRAETLMSSEEGLENPILMHNLGTLYARQDQFTPATSLLQAARDINQAEKNWRELASNYFMLASVSSRQGQFERARNYAQAALENDKKAEYSPGIAADLQALGRIAERLGEDQEAYQLYLRSLRVYLSINDGPGSLSVLTALEGVAGRSGRTEEAAEFAAERERIREAIE